MGERKGPRGVRPGQCAGLKLSLAHPGPGEIHEKNKADGYRRRQPLKRFCLYSLVNLRAFACCLMASHNELPNRRLSSYPQSAQKNSDSKRYFRSTTNPPYLEETLPVLLARFSEVCGARYERNGGEGCQWRSKLRSLFCCADRK